MKTGDRKHCPSSSGPKGGGLRGSGRSWTGVLALPRQPIGHALVLVAVIAAVEAVSHLTVHRLLPPGSESWGAAVDATLLSVSIAPLVYRFIVVPARERMAELSSASSAVIRSITDAVITIDEQGLVHDFNPAAEAIFGYSAEELIGQDVARLMPEPYASGHQDYLQAYLAGGPARVIGQRRELTALRRSGEEFAAELTVSELWVGGRRIFTGIVRDLSAEKEAERQLRLARDTAEAASHAKSDFLATMSHEIRTPMNGIIGMTELALRTNLSEEQRRYLDLVRLSADALMTLINEILDFSKIEAGRLELESVEFDPGRELLEALRPLAVRCSEKNLEIVLRVRPEAPRRVIGDPARFAQVVTNLVSNALKFTESGEIRVELRRRWRSTDDVSLELVVSDTGIGISPEALETIFEPFVQADMSTTRRYGGTGLGLAICTRIAALMEGNLRATSELGRGSEFVFGACFALPESERFPPPPPSDPLLEHLPVTLVEDNPSQAEALSAYLTELGTEPTLASDGPDALRKIGLAVSGGEPPAVVLIDLGMIGMDGLAVVECLKALHPGIPSAFVLLRNASESVDDERARRLGVAWSIEKPCRAEDVRRALFGALDGGGTTVRAQFEEPSFAVRPRARRSRILVVEDNLVNQKLAVWLLEQHGYDAVVASNGREALAILELQAFDAILMDVQMPELNGLDATRLIRAREADTGGHVPIIAVTAYAMSGDRERCLEAGMDAYLPKPIDERLLIESLRQMVLTAPEGLARDDPSPQAATRCDPAAESVTVESILDHYRGDRELVADMAVAYLEEVSGRIEALTVAVESLDAAAVERVAHGLKGSSSNFYAAAAVDALERMQQAGRDGDFGAARGILVEVSREVERLAEALRRASRGCD